MSAPKGHRKIRAIDLFCGAGGSSWGAKQAGVEVVAAFDAWPLAGKAHHGNFPGCTFIEGRLEDHDLSTLRERLGKIDLILASPECTNHSPAKGNKPRCEVSKNTAFEVVKFAEFFTPRWIVIENVTSMRKWSRYCEFKAALEKAGYQITEQTLNAAAFGVGQSRRRLFLMCDRKTKPAEVTPLSITPATAKSLLKIDAPYRWTPLRKPGRAKGTLERADRAIRSIGPTTPFLLVYYGSDGAGGWQTLNRPLRTITTVDRFALVRPTSTGHEMRMLQVEELKTAMGMSDMTFEHGSRRDRIKMLGNAVCPPVMKRVLVSLIEKEL